MPNARSSQCQDLHIRLSHHGLILVRSLARLALIEDCWKSISTGSLQNLDRLPRQVLYLMSGKLNLDHRRWWSETRIDQLQPSLTLCHRSSTLYSQLTTWTLTGLCRCSFRKV